MSVAAIDKTSERLPAATPRLAHLVLVKDWPVALCGQTVTERFGATAPAMDRCTDCLRIASKRKLGRPGWRK